MAPVFRAGRMAAMLLVASVAVSRAHECNDPYSADQLSMAVDAALMELQGQPGWFSDLRKSTLYPNAIYVSSCTPDKLKWTYPDAAQATGLLKRVLTSKTLKVAGVMWGPYKANPTNPSHFWASYLDGIADTLAAHYKQDIAVERVYYPNSIEVVRAVEAGVDVDMSEPYYYLGGAHDGTPRIESLAFSCITAAIESHFYTNKESSITSVEKLVEAISTSDNRRVGFIATGNYDSVSAILPANVRQQFPHDNETEIVNAVHSGVYMAGYVSEGSPPDASTFHVFKTGIVAPRVILFHKDKTWQDCADGGGDDNAAGIIAGLCTVAGVALLLTLTLIFLITKERAGSPIFQPLPLSSPQGVSVAGVKMTTSNAATTPPA